PPPADEAGAALPHPDLRAPGRPQDAAALEAAGAADLPAVRTAGDAGLARPGARPGGDPAVDAGHLVAVPVRGPRGRSRRAAPWRRPAGRASADPHPQPRRGGLGGLAFRRARLA